MLDHAVAAGLGAAAVGVTLDDQALLLQNQSIVDVVRGAPIARTVIPTSLIA